MIHRSYDRQRAIGSHVPEEPALAARATVTRLMVAYEPSVAIGVAVAT